jgi:hypothetical protein
MIHKGILYNWNVTDQWGWDLTQQNKYFSEIKNDLRKY